MGDHITTPAPGLFREMRRIATLGLPIVLSLLAVTLIGVVDTVMISPLGTVPMAAAALTASVIMFFYSGLYGFVSAISVRMAEAYGSGNRNALNDAAVTSLIVTVIVGLGGALMMMALRPFLLLLGQPPEVVAALGGYWFCMSALLLPFVVFHGLKGLFDAAEAPWLGVALAFTAVIINVPANWLFIYYFEMGLTGAGLASLLSESCSVVLALIVWRRWPALKDARQRWHSSGGERLRQLREGGLIATGYVAEGGAYAVVMLSMGWFGAVALAATQIVTSVANMLYMVPMGLSIAVSIRIGQAIGRSERERLRRIGLAALGLISGWMCFVVILLLLGRSAISEALSDDQAVVTLAASMFVVVALMQVFDGVQGTMLGACRGMTDNRVPMMITLACYWVIALPLGYTLGFILGWGPNAVWAGYGIGLALAAAFISWRFFNRTRGRAAYTAQPLG